MDVIIFKNTGGLCGVIMPTGIVQEAIKDVPKGLSYRITDSVNVPSDRTFRGAWTDDNPTLTVDVDMPKAKIIHMAKIRKSRDKALKVLDIETLKGIDVQAQKQILRDIPQTFNLNMVTSSQELNALWPVNLSR